MPTDKIIERLEKEIALNNYWVEYYTTEGTKNIPMMMLYLGYAQGQKEILEMIYSEKIQYNLGWGGELC